MRTQSPSVEGQKIGLDVTSIVVAVACGLAVLVLAVVALASRGQMTLSGTAVMLQALVLLAGAAYLAMRRIPQRSEAPVEDTVPLSAVVDLVTWHDAQGDVVRAGQAAAKLIGVPPAALQANGLLDRIVVADRPAFLKALSDAANGGGDVTVAFRLQTAIEAGGRPTVIFAEMRAHAVESRNPADGAVVIAFTRDVSAQHRHADELEAARLDAEKANELKGRFLATVTHELRTPLNAIIGFSELLGADHPFLLTEDRRKEYAQIIRTSGHHLLEIVNTLLDMSKIESGNFHFEPEPFDFGELSTSVCDLMQLKADEAGVTIERRIAADLPELLADRRACRQILINLLSNSVKFTPSGGKVTVRVSSSADSLVLVIADTGVGIPEADLPRLGDPFFQSGDVHRRSQEGTGLGLSVVRGIVGLHQGQIAVESGAGAGTTVTVTLPVRPVLDPSPVKPVVVQTRARVPARILERKIA